MSSSRKKCQFETCPICFGSALIIPNSLLKTSRTFWHAIPLFKRLPRVPNNREVVVCQESPIHHRDLPVTVVGRWAHLKDQVPRDRNELLNLVGLIPFINRLKERNIKARPTFHHFEGMKYLNGGASGTIYSAIYSANGRRYAIKAQIHDDDAKDDIKYLELILYEKKIMCSVRHPFVVNAIATFQDSKTLYIVMEEMVADLNILCNFVYYKMQKDTLGLELIRYYTAQIVLAVEYLHGMQIIHRDIKPHNIFIDQRGCCRIGDFGLSIYSGKDPTGYSGTPLFMAPEILDAREYSYAVDWFAVGLTIFIMATGDHPFRARLKGTKGLLGSAKVKWGLENVEYPETMNANLSDLIMKLTTFDYADRLGTNERGARELKTHPFLASINFDEVFESRDSGAVYNMTKYLLPLVKQFARTSAEQGTTFRNREYKFQTEFLPWRKGYSYPPDAKDHALWHNVFKYW